MANKGLFKSLVGKLIPQTDAVNSEYAPAYAYSPKHALAQYAATGCMNTTFYASAEDQLETVLKLANEVEPEFVAKVALFCRTKGHMKDLPALLCAVLSVRSPGLMAEVFDRVIDSPKMLRNFVQIMRSGQVGRKSLGTLPKRLVLRWIENRTDEQLFCGSVGNDPSLADIVKMVHPKPATKSRQALFGYLIGREFVPAELPEIVQKYEAFKSGVSPEIPDVPFQMLTSLELKPEHWNTIARNASWQMARMNLNTFARHGCFAHQGLVREIAEKLRDEALISKARAFPYQLMTAFTNVGPEVPQEIREALQDAMEVALRNVPELKAKVFVCLDISGSMQGPITGHRTGATTVMRCVDVAALIAAAIMRKNPRTEVLPFESKVLEDVRVNPRDSVMTNAQKLSGLPCGGTNCSAPLVVLNRRQAKGDLVIYVSDNESWVDAPHYGCFGGSRTQTMEQWAIFQRRNPGAKMVCIDLVPNQTTQASERADILNIGGFSDQVFEVISQYAEGTLAAEHWVGVIEALRI
jgi:60 kDa SS-A/Ro ribonucleoprotein